MRCEAVLHSLDVLRDGTLSPPEATDVREHFAVCCSCAREWAVAEVLLILAPLNLWMLSARAYCAAA